MKRNRKFNVATFASTILLCGTIILLVAAFFVNPKGQKISLTNNFHVSVWEGFGGDIIGRLVFFNNAEYGPYSGSIMRFGGESDKEARWGWSVGNYDLGGITTINPKGNVDKLGFCTLPGIYFRHWKIHDEARSLWTLMVSLWYPLFLFSILPVIWSICYWRSRCAKTLHG